MTPTVMSGLRNGEKLEGHWCKARRTSATATRLARDPDVRMAGDPVGLNVRIVSESFRESTEPCLVGAG